MKQMVPLPGTIWAEMDTTSVSQQFYAITKATNRITISKASCINGLESTGLEAGVFMTMLQGL
jgi:hypothetical protein